MCTSVRNQGSPQLDSKMDFIWRMIFSILNCAIIFMHKLFDTIVDCIFSMCYQKKAKKVPPVTNPLLLESAVSLAEQIRTRKVTSEIVVTAYIDRCKEVHNLINAIVQNRFIEAIKEAKEVDVMIENHKDIDQLKITKPFLGVPFTTKESIRVKGMIHSLGLVSRSNVHAEEDATVVRYMKEAGAILIGTTNIPELNQWIESRNNIYGQTNNPYDTTRNVGGSSGGEGAIMSASGTSVSIASDIGGSTRLPAFCNGLFGYKPSEGLTPVAGIGLRNSDYPDTMVSAGPLCRKAEDLVPCLKVLIGPNIIKLKLDDPVDVKKLNVFYQINSGDLRLSKVNETMHATLMKAVQHFKQLTGSATKIKIPNSEYSIRLWRYWMSRENLNFKLSITGEKYVTNAKRELYNLVTGNSQITFAAILKLIDEDFFPKENDEWARSATTKAKQYLLDKLGDDGVLLFTSSPAPTGYHYTSYFRPFNFGYFCFLNVLRFPTCQVPMGLDKNGLPVGIQVVAAPYNDHLCLAVAKELETAFGGWVPPS